LLEIERPSSNIVELPIDKGKYFNLILEDVMEIQSDLNMMNLWSDDAAQQFKIVVDREVLLGLLGQADTKNKGLTAGLISNNINLGVTGTPIQVVARNPAGTAGKVEIIDILVRLGQALDEQNIPETGRWVVLPAWISSQIKMSELRDASLTGDSVSILRNGRLGMVDRFTIYVSNLLPSGVPAGLAAGEWVIYAGTQHGLTFAWQINKVETLRSEMTFGTLLRGLQVVGARRQVEQVEVPDAVGHRLAFEAGVVVGDKHRGAGHRGAGRIFDVSDDRSVQHLCGRSSGNRADQHNDYENNERIGRTPPSR